MLERARVSVSRAEPEVDAKNRLTPAARPEHEVGRFHISVNKMPDESNVHSFATGSQVL